MSDYTVTYTPDRPQGGMWHCGPNAGWATVKHNPTGIMARAYHRQQHKAREIALACVEVMVAESCISECAYPEAIP